MDVEIVGFKRVAGELFETILWISSICQTVEIFRWRFTNFLSTPDWRKLNRCSGLLVFFEKGWTFKLARNRISKKYFGLLLSSSS